MSSKVSSKKSGPPSLRRGTPLLDAVKNSKKQGHVLEPLLRQWLEQNPGRIDNHTEADWEIIRQLIVRGTERDKSVFSPSSAMSCMRRHVISKQFELTQEHDSSTQLIFDDGNWRHIRWQLLFFKMDIALSLEEFKKIRALFWGGSTDVIIKEGVVEMSDGYNGRVIVDVKGANLFSWRKIRDERKPMKSHEIQLQTYMMLHNILWGILFYENKNTQEICEIHIRADKKLWRRLRVRASYMEKFVLGNSFPREECSVGDDMNRQYRGCPMREICPRLPVNVIVNGKIRKTHGPRIEDLEYSRYNELPWTRLKGKIGGRKQSSKKLLG